MQVNSIDYGQKVTKKSSKKVVQICYDYLENVSLHTIKYLR